MSDLLTVDCRFRILRIGVNGVVVTAKVGEEGNVALGYRSPRAFCNITDGHFLEMFSSQLLDFIQA